MKASLFTAVCQQVALVRNRGRADLHLHTIYSDGTHTPASLVERAVQAGLNAIAVTDHDTLAGVLLTQEAARGRLEVLAGVEMTCEWEGRELHLLGYGVALDHGPLNEALRILREGRYRRMRTMAERLSAQQVSVMDMVEQWSPDVSLGRRHLARLLVERGYAHTLHGAFTRLVAPASDGVTKVRWPVAEAIQLVRSAGGVCSWAHPSSETTREHLEALAALGLQAVECVYPWPTNAVGKRLRALTETLGLAISGGSDSHDPGPSTRSVGAKTITLAELAKLKQLALQPV